MTDDDPPRGLFGRVQSLLERLAALERDGPQRGAGRLGDEASHVSYEYSVSTGLAADRHSPTGARDPGDETAPAREDPHVGLRVEGEELHVVGLLPRDVECTARLDRDDGAVELHDGTETIERITLDGRDTPVTDAGRLVDDARIVGVSHNDRFVCVRLAAGHHEGETE
jgi:GvpH.